MVSRIDLGPDGGPYVELDEDAGEFIIRVPQDNVSFDGADLNSVGTASVSALEAESVSTEAASVGEAKPVTGGPIADKGERVDLITTVYAPGDFSTTADEFEEPGGAADRAVADYTDYPVTNLDDYRLKFSVYRFEESSGSGTAHFRVGSLGNAPDPIPGSEQTLTDGSSEFRFVVTTSIDISQFGQWTPRPEFKASDGGEARLQGFFSVTLTAVVE